LLTRKPSALQGSFRNISDMKKILYCLPILIFVACQPTQKGSEKSLKFEEIDDAYYVYTIGDWGRKGEFNQKELATTMGKVAETLEPEFIISTGDNFYPNGLASIHDPNWKISYEDVYSAYSLNCDWYVVLGNHDYRGNAQAQIDYSDISQRWNMPSRYFHKDIKTDDGASVRFIFLDTNPLDDDYYDSSKYGPKVSGQDTTAQLMWMDSLLAEDYDWKVVIGHHPLYTGGKRAGRKNAVRSHLEPRFDRHGVDLYLAGHEHDLQYIKPKNHSTHHFVSGAGSEVRPTGKMEETLFAESINGFLITAFLKDQVSCQFIDLNGSEIYKKVIKK